MGIAPRYDKTVQRQIRRRFAFQNDARLPIRAKGKKSTTRKISESMGCLTAEVHQESKLLVRRVPKTGAKRQSKRNLRAGVLHDSIIHVIGRLADEENHEPLTQIDEICDQSFLFFEYWTEFVFCLLVREIRWQVIELLGRKQDIQPGNGNIQREDGHGI